MPAYVGLAPKAETQPVPLLLKKHVKFMKKIYRFLLRIVSFALYPRYMKVALTGNLFKGTEYQNTVDCPMARAVKGKGDRFKHVLVGVDFVKIYPTDNEDHREPVATYRILNEPSLTESAQGDGIAGYTSNHYRSDYSRAESWDFMPYVARIVQLKKVK